MMEKNVLIIDDSPDKRALEEFNQELLHEVNRNAAFTYTVNLFAENPLPYIDLGKKPGEQCSGFYEFLDAKYLDKKLDMVLCDFNMHERHKHLAFHIINHIRKRNKICTIILYSGAPLKELIRLNNSDLATKISEHILKENRTADVTRLAAKLEELRKEEEPAEELMAMAVKSRISAIVSKNKYEEKAIELISKPSLLLWVENELFMNGDCMFSDGNDKLNGKKLSEIARHIREQTDEGIYFTNEIVKISLANLITLNS